MITLNRMPFLLCLRLHNHLSAFYLGEERFYVSPLEATPQQWTLRVIHAVQRDHVL